MFRVYVSLEQNAFLVVLVFLFLALIWHVAFRRGSRGISSISILLLWSLWLFPMLLEALFPRGSFRLLRIGFLLDCNRFNRETVIFIFYNSSHRFLSFNFIYAGSHICIRKIKFRHFDTFKINFISFSSQTCQKGLFSLRYLS